MADNAHSLTDKQLEEMERHISEIYGRAYKELSEKADKYFAQFQQMDEEKRKLVDSGAISEQQYKVWRQNKIMTGKHWTAMKDQAAAELLNANKTAAAYINGKLPDVYALNYNSVGNGIDNVVDGYSFEMVDASTVKNLATSDKTLLPYKYVDGKKDVRWNTQKVNSEILQGIIQGDSVPNLAKRLQNVTEMNRTSAIRNARTTVTSAENKGRMDMLHDAADKGVNVVKIWLATSDDRTREAHIGLNGQERPMDEPFDSELGEIMYPGDPDADPANVYNCRCTLIYKVVGFDNKDEEIEQGDLSLDKEWTPSGDYEPAESQKEFMMKNKDELKEHGVKNMAGIREQYENTMMQTAVKNVQQIGEQEAVDIARDKLPEGLRNQWFVDANSDAKPKLSDIILGDSDLLNAGWNIAYRDYMETVGQGSSTTFEQFLSTPMKMYRGTHGQIEQANETWISFSMDRAIAESFGSNIEEIVVRPIDTWGAYQTTAEAEILVPRRILENLRRGE